MKGGDNTADTNQVKNYNKKFYNENSSINNKVSDSETNQYYYQDKPLNSSSANKLIEDRSQSSGDNYISGGDLTPLSINIGCNNGNGNTNDNGDGVYVTAVNHRSESGRNMSGNSVKSVNHIRTSINNTSAKDGDSESESILKQRKSGRVPLSKLKDVNEGISGPFHNNEPLNVRLQNLKNAHKNDALMEDLDDIFESPTVKVERDEDDWDKATTANVSRDSGDGVDLNASAGSTPPVENSVNGR